MHDNREPLKGVERIIITGKMDNWRFIEAKKRHAVAAHLYQRIFEGFILPGYREIKVSLDEFKAGYDKFLGIDVFLNFQNGMSLTLQEKFLFTRFKTVTVEYYNDPRKKEKGDWFEMRAQLYFVGYDRIKAYSFQDWILLNWPAVVMETQKRKIAWQILGNKRDSAKANFKYTKFSGFTDLCIVAQSDKPEPGKLQLQRTLGF